MKKIILILSIITLFLVSCDSVKEDESKKQGYVADKTIIEQLDTTKTMIDVKATLGEPASVTYSTNTIELKYTYFASKDDLIVTSVTICIDKFTNQVKSIKSNRTGI